MARTLGKSMHVWAMFAIRLSRKTKVWTYFFRWKRRLVEKLSVKLKLETRRFGQTVREKVVCLCSILAVTIIQSAHAWTNSWPSGISHDASDSHHFQNNKMLVVLTTTDHRHHNEFGPGHRIRAICNSYQKESKISSARGANIVSLRLCICEPLVVSMWHHLIVGAAEILSVKVNQEAKWTISITIWL